MENKHTGIFIKFKLSTFFSISFERDRFNFYITLNEIVSSLFKPLTELSSANGITIASYIVYTNIDVYPVR